MLKHVGVALAAALILLTAAVGNATAHSWTSSHYYVGCPQGDSGYNARQFMARPDSNHVGYGPFHAGRATVYYGSHLYPCSPNSAYNFSLVAAVSAQAPGGFVQVEIIKASCYICKNGVLDGVDDFWYTAYDNTNGEIWPANWVDFDNDGTHDKPVVGHGYTFTIAQWSTTWQICVKRVSDGLQSCADNPYVTDHSPGYIETLWYGYELQNDAGALGRLDPNGSISISPMQYMVWNGSIYSTITNDDQVCDYVVSGGGAPWGDEQCRATGGAGTTTLNAYELWHS